MASDPAIASSGETLAPSSAQRIGVIGGGQLAWMMAQEAGKLGMELVVQTPKDSDPAVAIAADRVLAAIDDAAATAQLAQQCEVITFENEFVDLDALEQLVQRGVCFRPAIASLRPLLDKYDQRCYLQSLGLPVPRFIALEPESSPEALSQLGFPVVLKTRRHGYDGQGTFVLKSLAALTELWERLGRASVLLEEFVPFERELAAIACRSVSGDIAVYPIVETQQEDQVCRRVIAPAPIAAAVAQEAQAIARTLLTGLNAVGVYGIELFLTTDGRLLVNEVAPRTHNSGHFSLDACATSQFEQHLRAVGDRPLGSPALRSDGAVMINLLGYESSTSDYSSVRQRLAEIPQAHVHWYGKTKSRPGRKLGHVTVLIDAPPEEVRSRAMAIAHTVESIWYPALVQS